MSRFALAALGLLALCGCSARTNFTVAQDMSEVAVKKTTSTASPRSEKLSTTSFGNYEFKVTSPGFEPMTGILPLKFNGGYLALDILLFAPAMFFNLREPYEYYEFDLQQRVVRYRKESTDPWNVYSPTEAEAARGLRHFPDGSPAAAP